MPYQIEIYQLKEGEENHLRRWISYDSLAKMGEIPMLCNYRRAYEMQQDSRPNLERIYERFNVDLPKDFTGHSLSVSDIVVVQGGSCAAYYMDNVGFVRIPDFVDQLAAAEEGKEAAEAPVGTLRYLDSNETMVYCRAEEYIAAYQEALHDMGPDSVRAATLTKDLDVRYEIEKALIGEFGEKIEDRETWISKHTQQVSQIDPSKVRQFMNESDRTEPEDELER